MNVVNAIAVKIANAELATAAGVNVAANVVTNATVANVIAVTANVATNAIVAKIANANLVTAVKTNVLVATVQNAKPKTKNANVKNQNSLMINKSKTLCGITERFIYYLQII